MELDKDGVGINAYPDPLRGNHEFPDRRELGRSRIDHFSNIKTYGTAQSNTQPIGTRGAIQHENNGEKRSGITSSPEDKDRRNSVTTADEPCETRSPGPVATGNLPSLRRRLLVPTLVLVGSLMDR